MKNIAQSQRWWTFPEARCSGIQSSSLLTLRIVHVVMVDDKVLVLDFLSPKFGVDVNRWRSFGVVIILQDQKWALSLEIMPASAATCLNTPTSLSPSWMSRCVHEETPKLVLGCNSQPQKHRTLRAQGRGHQPSSAAKSQPYLGIPECGWWTETACPTEGMPVNNRVTCVMITCSSFDSSICMSAQEFYASGAARAVVCKNPWTQPSSVCSKQSVHLICCNS
jgi:hypothetical protein